jgi:4-amino-4-deoxy-L-arabinose transferase-like glycosyltransferase
MDLHALLDLVLIVWFAFIAHGLGKRVLARFQFRFSSSVEGISFSISLGAAVISFLALGLSVLGILYSSVLYAAFVICTVLFARDVTGLLSWMRGALLRLVRSFEDRLPAIVCLGLVLYLAVLALVAVVAALGPEIEYDALIYHLTAPKTYVEEHRLVSIVHTPETFFPKNIEMLFAVGMLLHDDITAKLMHFFLGLLLGITMYAYARRSASPIVGLAAAAIFISSPIVLWELKSAHIDVGLAHYLFVALYAFAIYTDSREPRWLALAAVMAGFALGIKYHALFGLASLLALLTFEAVAVERRQLRRIAMMNLGFLGIALSIFVPWILINTWQTGDPLFPLLSPVVSKAIWTDREASAFFNTFEGVGYPVRLAAWQNIGYALWGLSTAGWANRCDGFIGPFFLLMAPLIVMHRGGTRFTKLVLVSSTLYLVMWILTVQASRYLIPALPGFSIAGATALARILTAESPCPKLVRYAGISLVLALAIFMLPVFEQYNGGARHGQSLLGSLPTRVITGMETRHDYLTRWIRGYRVVRYCDQLSATSKVLFTWRTYGDAAYYMKRASMIARGPFLTPISLPPAELRQRLREMRVTHVVAYQEVQFLQTITNPEGEFVNKYLEALYQDDGVILYRVLSEAKDSDAPELSVSLTNHIAEARVAGPDEGPSPTINTGMYEIGGDRRYAMWATAPWSIEFTFQMPESPVLKFAAGRPENCHLAAAGRVLLTDPGTGHMLYAREVILRGTKNRPGWVDEQLDWYMFAGRTVKLTLVTSTSPMPDRSCDGLIWGNPELYSSKKDGSLSPPPRHSL